MDPRFFDYYNTELFHLRETAGEFAREFPKVASRLTLDGMDCADPYVERLLEGFAFLAARIQLKFDAEFPSFVQHLTEVVYPDFLSPVPAMAIAHFEPDMQDSALVNGVTIPRNTALRARLAADAQTACQFRTAHDVHLWPLRIAGVSFEAHEPTLPRGVRLARPAGGSVRIRLDVVGDASFDKLALNELSFFASGEDRIASRLYEHLIAYSQDVVVLPQNRNLEPIRLRPGALRVDGFGDSKALLPVPKQSFRAYRLLREYAAFPSRFLFFRLRGLQEAFRACKVKQVEIVITLSKADPELERFVDAGSLTLFATPIVNLFPKTADRIFLDFKTPDFHVVADRTRPMDFEVHSVQRVIGHGANMQSEIEIHPLYAAPDRAAADTRGNMFHTLRREKRVLSAGQKLRGTRTAYIGTELFIGVVDTAAPPFPDTLKQLSVETLCTNRDLAIMIPTGHANGDFTLDISAPVVQIRCLRGPSRPIPPALDGDNSWRLISQLSLNYLSLTDTSAEEGASALRQILTLYGTDPESAMFNQIQGIRSVRVAPIVRRLPDAPTVTFARGHEIELTCDPRFFEGFSPIVLGAVLQEFFARHASINSFTETVLRVQGRGEIKRWPARLGRRPLL